MQQSAALVVGKEPDSVIKQVYGTVMRKVEFKEMNDLYASVKQSDAQQWADRWIQDAEKVIETHPERNRKGGRYICCHDECHGTL